MPEPEKNREDYLKENNICTQESEEVKDSDGIYDPKKKDLTEHLEEIRNRAFIVTAVLAIGFMIAFQFSELLLTFLETRAPSGSSFFQLKPGESLFSSIKVAGFVALLITAPVLSSQVFSFLKPGLKKHEYKIIRIIFYFAPFLFLLGTSFAFYFILPPLLGFLLGFNSAAIESRYGIEHFVNLTLSLLFVSGLCFQLPLILLVACFFKIFTLKQLFSIWRYVVMGAFVISAFITPTPDPLTMSILAFALLGLYFITLTVIKILGFGDKS